MTDDFFSAELEAVRRSGALRSITTFEGGDGRTVRFDGKDYLLFCSNDYLGLSRHPAVITSAHEALDSYGFGSGGARLISGSRSPHRILEERVSGFLGTEGALTFVSGYSANCGIIPALAGKGDVILADKLNHASLLDGSLLSRATLVRYAHRDMEALERGLKKSGAAKNKWVITDGLFSMDGDMAPLDEICALARRHGARVYVDDAHAFGIMGKGGRGTPELFGVEGRVDVLMGTLGKAAGGVGAFVTAKKPVIDYLVNRARSFIFSTAMPPAVAAANAKAVEILSGFDRERKTFLGIVKDFHNRLSGSGIVIESKSYIIPIVTEEAEKALETQKIFWDKGVFLQAIRPPTVPEGTSRLRLTLSLAQTEEDRNAVLEVLKSLSGVSGK